MRTIWRLSAVNANIKRCVLDHSLYGSSFFYVYAMQTICKITVIFVDCRHITIYTYKQSYFTIDKFHISQLM